GEIDLDKGIAPEEMRLKIIDALKRKDYTAMGEVGERIASKFVKEKLNAVVFDKEGPSGADRDIILNGEYGVLEAKLTTYR
ncbi:MAG: hypothetical protein H3Z52_15025, partial [archaeon]|nr:hypothetical protein [archaeon]